MPFEITIQVNATDLARAIADTEARVAQLVQEQTQFLQNTWIAAVSGRVLPGMVKPVRSDEYAAAISSAGALQYPFNGDPFAGRVVALPQPVVQRVEEGYPTFDMKPGLLRGPKAKVAKDGHRYTVVPFTHTVPGSTTQKGSPMPPQVYALARTLRTGGPSHPALAQLGVRTKQPAQVNLEAQRRGRPDVMTAPYTHKASIYAGMRKTGAAGHTSYKTFRVVSDKSDPNSWVHPGQPPNPVVRAVQAFCEPLVYARFQQVFGGA